ncbi:MAG: sugar phosphate nucleotidyltransferase [Nitrososphaeria archaeon]
MTDTIIGGILCGGLGKRLRPITDSIPKSLIEIKEGYSILDRQIFQMKHAGIQKLYLLAGYLHEKIKERYGNSWDGVDIDYLIEEKPSGTLFAINSLIKAVEAEGYLIMNGDIVTDINIKQMIEQSVKGTVTIAVTKLVSPYGIVELSNGKIIGFKEKPTLPYYINAGIYLIHPDLRNDFVVYEEGAVEKVVFPLLAKKGLLNYYLEEGTFWQSVDSQKDLENVRKEFMNRVDKPWGYEKTIAVTDKYITTQLYLMRGCWIPKHYHKQKDETIHILSGEGDIYLEEDRVRVSEGDVVHIMPGKRHKIFSREPLTMLCYSTPLPQDYMPSSD